MITKIRSWDDVLMADNSLYLSDKIFSSTKEGTTDHQTLIAFQANARSSFSCQKTRGQVKHSTRKLYRQKGTGRARAGMSSSPSRRGGGRAFPNSGDEVFHCKINKATHKKVLRTMLSLQMRLGRLLIVRTLLPNFNLTKTQEFKKKVASSAGMSWLFVIDGREMDCRLYFATRNLPNIHLVTWEELNPRLLLLTSRIVVTEKGILQLQGLLQ